MTKELHVLKFTFRKILDAPGVNAYTLPGNEFLLEKLKKLLTQMETLLTKELLNS